MAAAGGLDAQKRWASEEVEADPAVRPGGATVLAPGARTRAGTTRGDPPGPWRTEDDTRGFGILFVTAEMTRVARGR